MIVAGGLHLTQYACCLLELFTLYATVVAMGLYLHSTRLVCCNYDIYHGILPSLCSSRQSTGAAKLVNKRTRMVCAAAQHSVRHVSVTHASATLRTLRGMYEVRRVVDLRSPPSVRVSCDLNFAWPGRHDYYELEGVRAGSGNGAGYPLRKVRAYSLLTKYRGQEGG